MVKVNLWSSLRRFTEGKTEVEVEATTVKEMLDGLKAAHPGLGPILDAGISVAIDGEVLNGNLHKAISSENEIFILQRMKGG